MDELERPLVFRKDCSKNFACCTLDYTIQRHQKYIVILKKQRNTLASISRLPPELLCKIFTIVRLDSLDLVKNRLEWLRFTHVNSHWRHVALSSATLWSTIDNAVLNCRPLLEKVIQRSAGAPLYVDADIETYPLIATGLVFCLRYSQRLQSISINLSSPEEWRRIVPKFENMSAPQLNSLFLICPSSRNREIEIPSAAFYLDLLLQQLPQMHHLALKGLSIKWNLSPFPTLSTLTCLTLHDLPDDMLYTWNTFSSVLRIVPTLEELNLKNAIPVIPIPWENPPRIPLTSLRTLLIASATTKEVDNLLSLISLSPHTDISIQSYDPQFTTLAETFLGLLAKFEPSQDANPYQSLVILEPDKGEIKIKLYMYALSHEQILAHADYPARLALNISWGVEPSTPDDAGSMVLKAMFQSALSLQDIMHVYLANLPKSFTPRMLADTIGILPQIRFVMAGSWCETFVDALQLLSIVPPLNALCFGNLSSIFLHGRVYKQGKKRHRAHRFDPSGLPAITLEKLYRCMAIRCQAGVVVKKLTLKAYPIRFTRTDVTLLHNVVGRVEWQIDGAFGW